MRVTSTRPGTTPNGAVAPSNSAVTAALNEQRNQAASGYFLPTNNCLTKSVAILNAYGVGLGYPGYAQAPNNYFDNLGNAGWGPVHPL
jgi:hypothetical protein